MNRSEVAQLLGTAAAYDKRTVGETDVVAWHRVLENVDLEDALCAVVDYYRDDTRPIMPAHVVALTRQMANERAMRRQTITAGREPADPSWIRQLRKAAPAYAVQDDDDRTLWTGPAPGLKALVLRHPDLSERLTQQPLNYRRADQWSGYVPPLVHDERRNESVTRAALMKIVRTAVARKGERHERAS